MSHPRTARRVLLAATLAAALTLPAIQTAQALTEQTVPAASTVTASTTPRTDQIPDPTAYDDADHVGNATLKPGGPAPAPGGGSNASMGIPGLMPANIGAPGPAVGAVLPNAPVVRTAAGVPCTVDGFAGLGAQQLADFLTDPAVTADGCLRTILWTWDARFASTMDAAHIKAVSDRIVTTAASEDAAGSKHLYELWTYLHSVVYLAWGNSAISVDTPDTQAALQQAVNAYAATPHAFDTTTLAGNTMREVLITGGIKGLRGNQLPLMTKVLNVLAPGTKLANDYGWGNGVFAALNANYLGISNGDATFEAAIAADPAYVAAMRAYSGYTHLKGTSNAWAARDAVAEYGRFGQIDALKARVTADLGPLLAVTDAGFGKYSDPSVKIIGWLNAFGLCKQYNVCTDQIEAHLFPYVYKYDNGAVEVHTALDKPTVDQMYYASKQVKTQYFRVLGTDVPLADDVNTTLHIHLYASRADYEVYHPLLTGMGTNNGGIYIERGATFYTYQRRVPQDSTLTLEELFRHEYTHYLNGRWAVPGYFGDTRWYHDDMTTAMDEGTAEFFDGSTRDQGIQVRKSLVKKLAQDEANGIPRMTIKEIIHSKYADTPAFHFYNYAGTFFEFLWQKHPSLIREMYGYQRADDPAGFDAWRDKVSNDAALQTEYYAFLDAQIKVVDSLYVPNTTYTANGALKFAYASQVKAAFAKATHSTPNCKDNGDWSNKPMRFVCTGRITANLSDSGSTDQVFKDMSSTVDYFILQRTKGVANNLDDMNCYFGAVDIWSSGKAGTSSYTCEGPLRR